MNIQYFEKLLNNSIALKLQVVNELQYNHPQLSYSSCTVKNLYLYMFSCSNYIHKTSCNLSDTI